MHMHIHTYAVCRRIGEARKRAVATPPASLCAWLWALGPGRGHSTRLAQRWHSERLPLGPQGAASRAPSPTTGAHSNEASVVKLQAHAVFVESCKRDTHTYLCLSLSGSSSRSLSRAAPLSCDSRAQLSGRLRKVTVGLRARAAPSEKVKEREGERALVHNRGAEKDGQLLCTRRLSERYGRCTDPG